MGFFKTLKDDISEAMNQLISEDILDERPEEKNDSLDSSAMTEEVLEVNFVENGVSSEVAMDESINTEIADGLSDNAEENDELNEQFEESYIESDDDLSEDSYFETDDNNYDELSSEEYEDSYSENELDESEYDDDSQYDLDEFAEENIDQVPSKENKRKRSNLSDFLYEDVFNGDIDAEMDALVASIEAKKRAEEQRRLEAEQQVIQEPTTVDFSTVDASKLTIKDVLAGKIPTEEEIAERKRREEERQQIGEFLRSRNQATTIAIEETIEETNDDVTEKATEEITEEASIESEVQEDVISSEGLDEIDDITNNLHAENIEENEEKISEAEKLPEIEETAEVEVTEELPEVEEIAEVEANEELPAVDEPMDVVVSDGVVYETVDYESPTNENIEALLNKLEDNSVPEEILAQEMEEIPEKTSDEIAVLIKDLKLIGNITTNGNLDVYGEVIGNLNVAGKLKIQGNVTGNVQANEIFVDGAKIVGNVKATKTVKVGAQAVIIGDVTASSSVIAGAIKGTVDVNGPVILDVTSIVKGDIKSAMVQINNGAVIEGNCMQVYGKVDVTTFFDKY